MALRGITTQFLRFRILRHRFLRHFGILRHRFLRFRILRHRFLDSGLRHRFLRFRILRHGSYGTSGYYDTGSYDTGSYGTSGYYDTGSYDSGSYDSGYYDSGYYDTSYNWWEETVEEEIPDLSTLTKVSTINYGDALYVSDTNYDYDTKTYILKDVIHQIP